MPKPLANQPGSGLHVNVSLLRDGKNLFDGAFTPDSEAGHFVAGILAHARELTAFCNPVPNSYARLGANEAPLYVSWSRQNRSQLVRLPSAHGAVNRNLFHPSAAAGLDSLPRTLREAITVAGQSEFISRELPVALMNKYFEYQTQLCHDAEGAPDTESWERAHSFLII